MLRRRRTSTWEAVIAIRRQCKTCEKHFDPDVMFSPRERFCTFRCFRLHSQLAVDVGGYHVLARDERISELEDVITALVSELSSLRPLLKTG